MRNIASYQEGYTDGYDDAKKKYERPKGEWISQFDYCKQHNMIPTGYGCFWWCNQCDSSNEKKTNFCPNCGAQMVGGEEE